MNNEISYGIGYCRINGAKDENSLDEQKAAIIKYAEKQGIKDLSWFHDHEQSGKVLGGSLKYLIRITSRQRKQNKLYVMSIDRISRDMLTAIRTVKMLKNNGIEVIFVNENTSESPEFTLTESIFSAINDYKSKKRGK